MLSIKPMYSILAFIIAAALSLAVLIINKLKRENSSLKSEKEKLSNVGEENRKQIQSLTYQNQTLVAQTNNFSKTIAEKDTKFEEYRKEAQKNFNESIPYGERQLLNIFRKLLKRSEYKDWKIYSHLEYQKMDQYWQTDFLVVSPFGIIVIESKFWKGLTLIFTSKNGNPLASTQFKNFGVGSSKAIAVYNINKSVEESKLVLSEYANPVAQVRQYSIHLQSVLNERIVNNAVLFHTNVDCQVKIDGSDLDMNQLDTFTYVGTQESVASIFELFMQRPKINQDRIIEKIEKDFKYMYCLDYSNVDEAPWGK